MAPATTAGANGKAKKWTRDKIIERIKRWNDLYGEPPRAADWSPASAKWTAAEWRTERYHAGDPETGERWPSLNAAKAPFDGSLKAAVRAAGLRPHAPGPRRRRAPHTAEPHVAQRAPSAPRDVEDELDAARERVRAADRHAANVQRRLNRAVARAERAEAKIADARHARRLAKDAALRARRSRDNTKMVKAEALDAAKARVADAEARASAALDQAQAADANRHAAEAIALSAARAAEDERDAAELARRDADAAHDAADAAVARAGDRMVAAERALADASAEAEVDDRVGDARRVAHDAELRAATAERKYRELATLVTGEQRQLTAEEIDVLKTSGPQGPTVMARALKSLARARADGGNPARVHAALTQIAGAAIGWRDRLDR